MNLSGPILISGANGMLGTDLSEHFKKKFGKLAIPLNRSELDITNAEQVRHVLRDLNPAVVINAAAYTNVDGAEKERELAHAINAQGPKNLVAACAPKGTLLVHFSSDYVFNGENTIPWKEEDPTDPPKPGYYAETKLEGEKAVLNYKNALVLRVQWLYGKKKDRFSPLKTKKTFTPIIDQRGAPTWTREIAFRVEQLLEKKAHGLFHLSYDDSASWYEVFQLVKQTWNLDVELIPKKSSELGLPAKRPLYCVLDNGKLCNTLGLSGMGSWKKPLLEFLASLS